jgi:dTMP kinase
MIKISICGTHSTGKTTLSKKIAEALNIPFIKSDISKDILDEMNIKNFEELEKLSYDTKLEYELKMLKSLSMFEDIECVTDGNPLSCIPYGRKLLGENNIEILYNARSNVKNFSHIFYLPPEIDFEDDSYRYTDLTFRKEIDEELFKELEETTYFNILTGTIEDRLNLVLKALNKKENNRNNHIVFEGICNSGKTTIINWITETLKKDYYLIERPKNPNNKTFDNLEEMYDNINKYKKELLDSYISDVFYFHKKEEVTSKIETGKYVIADRQKFSIIAYGVALGYSLGEMYFLTRDLPTPGTIIFFDINATACGLRASREKPLYNFRSNVIFQAKMNETFESLAKYHIEVKKVNAAQSPEDLFRDTLQIIEGLK